MQYVGYLVLPSRARQNAHLTLSDQDKIRLQKQLDQYVQAHPGAQLLDIFVEAGDKRRNRTRWPQLEKALQYCQDNRATLLVAELRNLPANGAFSDKILTFIGKTLDGQALQQAHHGQLACCDQPYITHENFPAIVEHARQQRKMHGELIKQGLSRTTAKSGNPNAAEVISRVNRPKIDNAISFALMLQPVIAEYRQRGYSQRKMVAQLNEEGFTAPEGGKWVLSQFQKVLDRVKLNESALSLENNLKDYQSRGMSFDDIAQRLNSVDTPCPKGRQWTADLVEQTCNRVKEIYDIIKFNEFVISLEPILRGCSIDELDAEVLGRKISESEITVEPALMQA